MSSGKSGLRETFLPLSRPSIGKEEIEEVIACLRSGWITTGPRTKKFEEEFSEYVGAKCAVAVSSATAGLHISLLSLGIGNGDAVITSPLTFAATANVIVLSGARPIFADIDRHTLQIDPDEIVRKMDRKTRCIIPVHFGGQPCDMDKIKEIASRNAAEVLEDAAHAVGTEYKGHKIGAQSRLAVFSFHPIKNITTGEGGMVVTSEKKLAETLRKLRFHGIATDAWKRYRKSGTPTYDLSEPGFKYNITDIQAALGIHQLRKLDRFIEKRAHLAALYNSLLANIPEIEIPKIVPYPSRHAWHLYPVIVNIDRLGITRNQFVSLLAKENIGAGVHFPAVHLLDYYRRRFGHRRGNFPNAEYVCERIVSLPLFPSMGETDVEDVTAAVKKIIRNCLRKC
jgi:dTDP-4-amino-4,6-dideoxygalactose transaminase